MQVNNSMLIAHTVAPQVIWYSLLKALLSKIIFKFIIEFVQTNMKSFLGEQ